MSSDPGFITSGTNTLLPPAFSPGCSIFGSQAKKDPEEFSAGKRDPRYPTPAHDSLTNIKESPGKGYNITSAKLQVPDEASCMPRSILHI